MEKRLATFSILFLYIWKNVDAECIIHMKVRSMTTSPFKFYAKVASVRAETEEVIFTRKGQQKQVKVTGPTCMGEPWLFRTYKNENGNWIPAKQGTAKLNGMGSLTVIVDDTLVPRIPHLFGIHCSESMICG